MRPDPAIPPPLPILFLRFIGALEVLGALGLVLTARGSGLQCSRWWPASWT